MHASPTPPAANFPKEESASCTRRRADLIPGKRYLFGCASPALLGTIALMRAGGRRIVAMTDTGCVDLYDWEAHSCHAFGVTYRLDGGSIDYPKQTPILVDVTVVDVCRPTIYLKYPGNDQPIPPDAEVHELRCR